jgi:hypothetical protein
MAEPHVHPVLFEFTQRRELGTPLKVITTAANVNDVTRPSPPSTASRPWLDGPVARAAAPAHFSVTRATTPTPTGVSCASVGYCRSSPAWAPRASRSGQTPHCRRVDLRPAPPVQTPRRPLGTPNRTPRRIRLVGLQPHLPETTQETPILIALRTRSEDIQGFSGCPRRIRGYDVGEGAGGVDGPHVRAVGVDALRGEDVSGSAREQPDRSPRRWPPRPPPGRIPGRPSARARSPGQPASTPGRPGPVGPSRNSNGGSPRGVMRASSRLPITAVVLVFDRQTHGRLDDDTAVLPAEWRAGHQHEGCAASIGACGVRRG